MPSFFHSRSVRILSAVLLAQASLFYGFSRRETVPQHKPLEQFSLGSNTWRLVDDILSRVYQNRQTGAAATLFVAYFETQRTGKAPHSPKNCLPGSGWVQQQAGTIDIPVPGQANRIRVNQYVVARGQNQSVVLYWYQAHNRVIASEYSAKIYTVTDAIRYNRSDTSLVRVVVGVNDGNTQMALSTAISFVQSFFEPLKEYLPA